MSFIFIFFSVLFHFSFLFSAEENNDIVRRVNDFKTGLPIYIRKSSNINMTDETVTIGGLILILGLSIKVIDKLYNGHHARAIGGDRAPVPIGGPGLTEKINQLLKNIGWTGALTAALGIGIFGFGMDKLTSSFLLGPTVFYSLKKLLHDDPDWWNDKDEDKFFSDYDWSDIFIAGGSLLSGSRLLSNYYRQNSFEQRQLNFFKELEEKNKKEFAIKKYFNIDSNSHQRAKLEETSHELSLDEREQNFSVLVNDTKYQQNLNNLMKNLGLPEVINNDNWRVTKRNTEKTTKSLLRIIYYDKIFQDRSLENVPDPEEYFNTDELKIWNKIGKDIHRKIENKVGEKEGIQNQELSLIEVLGGDDSLVKYPILNNNQNIEKIFPIANFSEMPKDFKNIYFEKSDAKKKEKEDAKKRLGLLRFLGI